MTWSPCITGFIRPPREIALPIHPAVTLEDWVGAIHLVILDGGLDANQQADLLAQIDRDPLSRKYYEQACADEQFLVELYGIKSNEPLFAA